MVTSQMLQFLEFKFTIFVVKKIYILITGLLSGDI